MKVKSIYEGMEKAFAEVKENQNAKLITRHSIRETITDTSKAMEALLTDEGKALARFFGRSMECKIGFVASSGCRRCIQTVENILEGHGDKKEVTVARDVLEVTKTQDEKELDGGRCDFKGFKETVFTLKSAPKVKGFIPLKEIAGSFVDYMFSTGGKEGTVDIYCTHDFQIALLYAYFFDYGRDRKSLEEQLWPRMLEGLVFWGKRNDYYVSFRNQKVHVVDDEIVK